MKTHYEVLGIGRDAAPDEIKSAWKARIREVHPDVFQGPAEEATERAIEVNGAYAVLSDPEKRALYDRMLEPLPDTLTAAEEESSPSSSSHWESHDARWPRASQQRVSRDEQEWAVGGASFASSDGFSVMEDEKDARDNFWDPNSLSDDRYQGVRRVQEYERTHLGMNEDVPRYEPFDSREGQILCGGIGFIALGLTACLSITMENDSPSMNVLMWLGLAELLVTIVSSNLLLERSGVGTVIAIQSILSMIAVVLFLMG